MRQCPFPGMQKKNAKIFMFLMFLSKEIYVFDAPVEKKYPTLHYGNVRGLPDCVGVSFENVPWSFSNRGPKSENETTRKGLTLTGQSLI